MPTNYSAKNLKCFPVGEGYKLQYWVQADILKDGSKVSNVALPAGGNWVIGGKLVTVNIPKIEQALITYARKYETE